jgi:hypothetical protein
VLAQRALKGAHIVTAAVIHDRNEPHLAAAPGALRRLGKHCLGDVYLRLHTLLLATGGSANDSQPSTPGPGAAVDDVAYLRYGILVGEGQTML